jgi:4-hydroxy-tetrahydrodipicolinate synthase
MGNSFKLRGVITALITPFTLSGEVDEEAIREIIRFQLKSRVHGFYPLGTTGLGPAMDDVERKRVAEIIVEETNGHVPIIVQVGACNPAASLELAVHAEKIGANAVASLTPFYYHPDEEAILEYYQKLSRATNLPLFVYNIPQNTGFNVEPILLQKLSEIPSIVGIKDSSGDFLQLLDYMRVVPDDFNVIPGTDSYIFSALCAGIHAGVSATASAFPEVFVEMYEAYNRRDFEKGKALQITIRTLRDLMSTPSLAPILEVLKMRGLKSGYMRLPLRSMHSREVEALRAKINRILPDLKLTS